MTLCVCVCCMLCTWYAGASAVDSGLGVGVADVSVAPPQEEEEAAGFLVVYPRPPRSKRDLRFGVSGFGVSGACECIELGGLELVWGLSVMQRANKSKEQAQASARASHHRKCDKRIPKKTNH